MKRTGRKQEWSIALFGFALLVFFPPVLKIFDRPLLIGGLPLAFLFLFGIWALVILAIAIGARRRHQFSSPQDIPSDDTDARDPDEDLFEGNRSGAE